MIALRPYQNDALDAVRANMRRGVKAQVLCLPTGGGKTIVAGDMINAAKRKGNRSVFVADREVLVMQASQRLHEAGVSHGVVMGQHTRDIHQKALVASAQTLEKRGWWQNEGFWSTVSLLIVDECHAQRDATTKFIQSHDIRTIGLSATPFTGGLGKTYSAVVNACTTDDLIRQGWLAPLRVYCPDPIDMTGAATAAGEWTKKAAEERALPVVGDVVTEWVKHTRGTFGGPVRTMVFSASVAHGEELVRQFGQQGYRFEQISYLDRDADERQRKLRALTDGRITGVISVDALGRGTDIPTVQCIVAARPYRNSLAAWIQQIGRGMRSADGKAYCVLLDHTGNWLRFVDDVEDFWASGCNELDDGTRRKAKAKPREPAEDRKCQQCNFAVPKGADNCPMCGAAIPRRRVDIPVVPGTLTAYDRAARQRGINAPDPWPSLCRMALDRAKPDPEKWARVKFKVLTGQWPARHRPFEPADRVDPFVEQQEYNSFRRWVRAQRKVAQATA